jgi:hypothetical protein
MYANGKGKKVENRFAGKKQTIVCFLIHCEHYHHKLSQGRQSRKRVVLPH